MHADRLKSTLAPGYSVRDVARSLHPTAEVIEGIGPRDLEKGLAGRTILAAKRLGKHLWLELQDSPALLLHFGECGDD